MEKKRCTAIVLAAGNGSRMNGPVAKQFMLLDGKPLIWYALQAVETSQVIDDCILVAGEKDVPYMRCGIVEKYGFRKVEAVVAGGSERCFSVANALLRMDDVLRIPNCDGYVFIHDGARPFLTEAILRSAYEAVRKYHACVAAVPSKDTVKIADREGFAAETPDRSLLWSIQTPQVFDTGLIRDAYAKLLEKQGELQEQGIKVTDDAGVVELFTDTKVRLTRASYRNIKITTPEDLLIAESFLRAGIKNEKVPQNAGKTGLEKN